MTVAEYLSAHLFPLTSQPGLRLEQQMRVDAANYDDYMRAVRTGSHLTDEERAIGRELEAKHAARGSVMSETRGGWQEF